MKTSYWMTSVAKTLRPSVLKASLILQVSLFLLWACDNSPEQSEYRSLQGFTMGTQYHITYKPLVEAESQLLSKEVAESLNAVESSMTTYNPESELMRFNALEVGESVAISEIFFDVYQVSNEVYLLSGQAFDPTIGPLVELWGFGSKQYLNPQLPDQALVAQAKSRLGFSSISLEGNKLLKGGDVALDFSAVAKGYAVDVLAELFEQKGIRHYMIEVGGEVRTKGQSPRQTPWRIAMELPQSLVGQVNSALLLNDAAVATSGDYRNFFEVDGKVYSHTIDPRTGWPADHKLSQVTVISSSVADSDAWATALLVLGEEEGFLKAQEHNLAAYFIMRTESGYTVKYTQGMTAYLEAELLKQQK